MAKRHSPKFCQFCHLGIVEACFPMEIGYKDIYSCRTCAKAIEYEQWDYLEDKLTELRAYKLPIPLRGAARKAVQEQLEEFRGHRLGGRPFYYRPQNSHVLYDPESS